MPKSAHKFAQLLTQAVRRISLLDDRKIQIVQDELGYALGRDAGGSSIEYWRKGHIPARLDEVEQLARELAQRGGLTDAAGMEQFLIAADHPNPGSVVREMLPQLQTGQSHSTIIRADNDVLHPTPSLEEHPTFLAGPPITHPYYFFGREREVRRLFNLLKRRPLQNGAIIGPRRSGKTSLLNYLARITTFPAGQLRPGQHADWLPNPQQYRWILVDFQDSRLGSREGLLRYLLAQLQFPSPDPCDLDRFLDIVSQNLMTPTIILFDEIGVALQRYPELDDSFWEGLRALATNQVGGNLAFILSSRESPGQLARHNDFGSPFFNIFGYTALLGPFSDDEARQLISLSSIPFSDEDVTWVLEHSGRWPMLLQILCRERLLSLEDGETGPTWREDALRQLEPFRYLME
jgi:hypothetical protein